MIKSLSFDFTIFIYRFIDDGGWDILNQWLTDFKELNNPQLLTEIMKLYREMPVTVDLLKKNSAAKTIKQLSKSAEHEGMYICSFKQFVYFNLAQSSN